MCEKVCVMFSKYKDKRPIKRQTKHTIVPDIFHMGYSVVNHDATKELDNIFTSVSPGGEGSSKYGMQIEELQNLLIFIAEHTSRVYQLEKKVRRIEATDKVDNTSSSLSSDIRTVRLRAIPLQMKLLMKTTKELHKLLAALLTVISVR